MITKANYEIYFIDYIDGNLSKDEEAELFSFLDKHAALKEEFNSFYPVELVPEPTQVDFSHLLKPTLTKQNQDDFFIAYHEDELDSMDQKRVLDYAHKAEETKRSFLLFEKAKLVANNTLIYPNKSELLKKDKTIFLWISGMAAMLAGIYFMIGFEVNDPNMATLPTKSPTPSIEKSTATKVQQPLLKELAFKEPAAFIKPLVKTINARTSKQVRATAKQIKQYSAIVSKETAPIPKESSQLVGHHSSKKGVCKVADKQSVYSYQKALVTAFNPGLNAKSIRPIELANREPSVAKEGLVKSYTLRDFAVAKANKIITGDEQGGFALKEGIQTNKTKSKRKKVIFKLGRRLKVSKTYELASIN